MTQAFTIECNIAFGRRAHGRKVLDTPDNRPLLPPGQLPRVSRLMALAIRFEGLVRSGAVQSYGEIAELGHVTRARVTQIMNLNCLAPDIQEAILQLPRVERGRAPLTLADLQPIARHYDWAKQRRIWQRVLQCAGKPDHESAQYGT